MDYIYCIIVFYYCMFIVLNALCIFLVICLLLKRLYTRISSFHWHFFLVKIHENFVKKPRNSVILLPLGSSLFRFAVIGCKCCVIFPPVQR